MKRRLRRLVRIAVRVVVVILAAAHVAEMFVDAVDREARRHPVMF